MVAGVVDLMTGVGILDAMGVDVLMIALAVSAGAVAVEEILDQVGIDMGDHRPAQDRMRGVAILDRRAEVDIDRVEVLGVMTAQEVHRVVEDSKLKIF